MVLEKKKATQPKNFYQPVRNRTTCWAKISQCHLQDTLAMWQESSRKKLLWRAVEIDTYPVRHPHVKYIPHKHSQPHSHTHKTHMQISRSWMVLGRSWGKWRLLSACTCVCIQYKSKHVCLRLSTLEQYDESGYWLKGSLSFYQQIVPPTVVIIPMWTHTFTHSHAHREQQ